MVGTLLFVLEIGWQLFILQIGSQAVAYGLQTILDVLPLLS
jgi:hypothetical protein